MNVNVISAQGTSHGFAGPNMRTGPLHRSRSLVLLRGHIEEAVLEHRAPV